MPKSTNLEMKGTAGRKASPVSQQKSLMGDKNPGSGKPNPAAKLAGLGTTMGGKPSEQSGVIDPATFNVDYHALRAFSSYMTGKRAGPDWLHKRVEAAERQRFEEGMDLHRKS